DLNRWRVHDVFVYDLDALERRHPGSILADDGGRQLFPAQRITADALARRIAERLNERRLLRGVIGARIPERKLVTRAPARLNVIESDSAVDSQPSRGFPGVLCKPLDVQVARVTVRMIGGF